MTGGEAITAVRAGGRCETTTTRHGLTAPDPAAVMRCGHWWRDVACDGDTDVLECYFCGAQRLARCSFDEDFA